MSEEESAGWRETVHLLASPKNAERLMASIRQARAGGARERTQFEEQSPTPGTPECEKFSDIAKALKEIEAERQRAAQAATSPEEKK